MNPRNPRPGPQSAGRAVLSVVLLVLFFGIGASTYVYFQAAQRAVPPPSGGTPDGPGSLPNPGDGDSTGGTTPDEEPDEPEGPPQVVYVGSLSDTLGKKIVDATIRAFPSIDDAPESRSDSDGSFEISLPSDRPPLVTVEAPGYYRTTIELEKSPPIPYTLYLGGTIRGTVRGPVADASGLTTNLQPAASVRIEVAGSEGWIEEVVTDPDGAYSITAPPGPVVITLRAPAHADQRVLDVEVEREGDVVRDVALEAGVLLELVLLANGTPLPGASVRAITDLGEEGAGETNPVGKIEFPGLSPGSGRLVIVRPGFRAELHSIELSAESPRTRRSVTLEPCDRWDIIVLDSDGVSVSDAEARITLDRIELLRAPVADLEALQVLGKGRSYWIEVVAPDRPRTKRRHRLDDGESTLRITLARGSRFTGRVVGPREQPLGSAGVLFVPVGGPSANQGSPRVMRTNLDGTFRSELLAPGPYRIQVDHPRLGRAVLDERLEGGSDRELGTVRLDPTEN